MLSFVNAAFAIDQVGLDNRVRTLTAKFEALQNRPDKAIPAETLRRAQGIVLLDRTKAGLVFAYEGGGGVAMVKDSRLGYWSPIAFMSASEASVGFQIGGEQNFYVILLMTPDAARMLTNPKFNFGGEAAGTAGETSGGVQGNATPPPSSVLVYSDQKGLYGGAALKGGAISPDDKANQIYYGQYVTVNDILFGHMVRPTETAVNLANKVNWYSQHQGVSQSVSR